jgi:hypothetical protein
LNKWRIFNENFVRYYIYRIVQTESEEAVLRHHCNLSFIIEILHEDLLVMALSLLSSIEFPPWLELLLLPEDILSFSHC